MTHRPMRIVLVEDHRVTQELMRQWFSLLPGASIVHLATSSAGACEWLQEHRDGWDLAVIDLFLADGHGFDVLRQCRGRRPGQRAVLLTNYPRAPVREYARLAGADGVFDKGFEMEALMDYCRRFQAVPA